jgi:sortase A
VGSEGTAVESDVVPTTHRVRPRWLGWLERTLWVGGALALVWVAWGWVDARLYQAREERLLEEALLRGTPGPASRPAEAEGIPADELSPAGQRGAAGAPAASGEVGRPATPRRDAEGRSATGAARSTRAPVRPSADGASATGKVTAVSLAAPTLARISLPRVGIRVMVASDVGHQSLRRAVGHIPGTSPLGSAGNVGIAGHRDTFFRPLKGVRIGDEIVLTTPGAVTRYRVQWAEVMSADDPAPLRQTDYPALTLVTCYPFYYVGNAPDRFVVRARLVESRAASAADARQLLDLR